VSIGKTVLFNPENVLEEFDQHTGKIVGELVCNYRAGSS
jgi:hypothetical protein